MMNSKRASAFTIGLTLFLGFAACTATQSNHGKENTNAPAAADILGETEVLEAPGDISISNDADMAPIASDIIESSVCTCEQVNKQGEQLKRIKDQDLVENLVIEKKSGKSFDVITITIPNDKKQRSQVETLVDSAVKQETITLDDSTEESVKYDDDAVKGKPDEKSTTTQVEEESEADKDTTVIKKTKNEKVKGDKKSLKSSEKKRTKRTTHKGGKRYGKKGKGKGKR